MSNTLWAWRVWRAGVHGLLMLGVTCSLVGCSDATSEKDAAGSAGIRPSHVRDGGKGNAKSPLPLILSNTDGADRDQWSVKLKIQNVGDEPLLVDGLFSIFFNWEIRSEAHGWVQPVSLQSIEPDAEEFRSRFISIEPGTSIEREFQLGRRVRRYITGTSDAGGIAASEAFVRYVPPDDVDSIEVRMSYGMGFADPAAFELCFEHTPEEVGIWTGKSETEWLTVRLQ